MAENPDTTLLPSPDFAWSPPARSKSEREYRAFRRLLPQLLQTCRGQYVAIHEGQVIDRDSDEMALILRTLARVGNVDIHVGLVTEEPEPMYCSGVFRELPQ